MSQIYSIVNTINTQSANIDDDSHAINVSQARLVIAIASALPLPKERSATYAWSAVFPQVINLLDELNENYVIDLDGVKEGIKVLYRLRWSMCHSPADAALTMGKVLVENVNFIDDCHIPMEQVFAKNTIEALMVDISRHYNDEDDHPEDEDLEDEDED